MIIVPVIDLLNARAVLAKQGHRASYQPLNSALCRNGEVLPLVHRLVEDWGFTRLYIADLDAIQGLGSNTDVIDALRIRFPHIELLLDGGFGQPDDITQLAQIPELRPVVGSETWHSHEPVPNNCLLSIDSDQNGPRDPSGVCEAIHSLPKELILMNLARVGSTSGPDTALLAHWQKRAPQAHLFAAGGVRDRNDLDTLRKSGAHGVLLASALHSGHLQPSDIRP